VTEDRTRDDDPASGGSGSSAGSGGPDAAGAGDAEADRRADRGRRRPPWTRAGGPAGSSFVDEDPGWHAAARGGRRGSWKAGEPTWGPGRPPWGAGPPPWVRRRGTFRRFGAIFAIVAILFAVVLVAIARVALTALAALLAALTGRSGPAGGADLLSAAALVVLAVAVVAVVAAGRGLSEIGRPLDDLVDAAGRVEGGDYRVRVAAPVRGPRALRDLVRGFNTMVARLEGDEAQRRSLLADVSHELRTPISVVQGNLEAILDGVYPADRAHLEPLLDETRVLTRLVDDLRTLALADAGTLALNREPTDLAVLVADVAASFRAAAADGRLEIAARARDLPLVDVDPIRIREVVSNLVANAIGHTPAGGSVTIAADRSGEEILMRVSDTGAGIPPELLPHVFERFARGPESRGSGLGLAIARGLVEAHGGTIEAESQPGRGTTFTVRLPLERAG
jgi:two-component system sensor histidine kinase BaeS